MRSLSKAFFNNINRAWLLTFSIQVYKNYFNNFSVESRAADARLILRMRLRIEVQKVDFKEPLLFIGAFGGASTSLLLPSLINGGFQHGLK